ncbi:MAG: hypothetical protein WCR42_03440 [bacterium]
MDTVFKSLRYKNNAQAVLGFIINDRSIVLDNNLCYLNTVPTDINKEHLSIINEIRNRTTGPIFRRIKF